MLAFSLLISFLLLNWALQVQEKQVFLLHSTMMLLFMCMRLLIFRSLSFCFYFYDECFCNSIITINLPEIYGSVECKRTENRSKSMHAMIRANSSMRKSGGAMQHWAWSFKVHLNIKQVFSFRLQWTPRTHTNTLPINLQFLVSIYHPFLDPNSEQMWKGYNRFHERVIIFPFVAPSSFHSLTHTYACIHATSNFF